MKKSFALLCTAVLVLFGCSKEISDNSASISGGEMIPYSVSVSLDDAKAELQSDGKVFWTEGDNIAVYDGTALREFTLASGAGATSATFTGEISAEAKTIEAVYPFAAASLGQGGEVICSVPAEQTIAKGKIVDPAAIVAKAAPVAIGQPLAFKNQVALLQFTVSDEATVYFVSGANDPDFAGEGNPYLQVVCPAAGTYCAAVLPGTYGSFNVFVDFSVKNAVKPIELAASKILNLGNVSNGKSAYPIFNCEDLNDYLSDPMDEGYLMQDIDASAGIAGCTKAFSKVFDGQGNKICNWTSEGASLFKTNSEGKIANVIFDESCKLSYPTTIAGDFGFLVCTNEGGEVLNCVNNAAVSTKGLKDTDHTAAAFWGSLIGSTMMSYSRVENCVNNGDIDISINVFSNGTGAIRGYIGGVVGRIASDGAGLTSCENNGNITLTETAGGKSNPHYLGGVVGSCLYNADIVSCRNTGKITHITPSGKYGYFLGGVTGISMGNLVSCTNTGDIEYKVTSTVAKEGGFKTTFFGGVAGYCSKSVTDCFNSGNLSLSAKYFCGVVALEVYQKGYSYDNDSVAILMGGVVGAGAHTSLTETSFYMKDCINTGNLSFALDNPMDPDKSGSSGIRNCFGGLVGDASGNVEGTSVEKAYNSGNINVSITDPSGTFTYSTNSMTPYVGGIAGANYYFADQQGMSITNCGNSGNIDVLTHNTQATSHAVGGIVGWPGKESSCTNVTKGCVNSGNVTVTGNTVFRAGGIQGGSGRIEGCTNSGAIKAVKATSDSQIGGIAGFHSGGYQLKECKNTGAVSADIDIDAGGVGGIAGKFGNSAMTIGQDCAVNCTVAATASSNAGAVIGAFNGSTKTIEFGPVKVKGTVKGVTLTESNFADYLHGALNYTEGVHIINATFGE